MDREVIERAARQGTPAKPSAPSNSTPAKPSGPTRRASSSTPSLWRSPLQAVILRPILTTLIFLICVGGSLAFSLRQEVTYDAEARVVVGRVDVESNAVPGFTNANANLAQTYSRFVGTTLHRNAMSKALELPVADVAALGSIKATPIIDSPIIRVIATADNEDTALALAGAGTTALIDLVAATNDTTSQRDQFFAEYQAESAKLAQAEVAAADAQRTLDAVQGTNGVTSEQVAAAQQVLISAKATVLDQQAKADAALAAYQQSQAARTDGELLRELSAASSSGNDRLRNVQLGLGAGVLLGAFVSIGFVWLLANRNALRAFRAESAITPRPVQKPPRTAGAPVPNGPAGDTALNRRDLKAAKDVSPPNPS